MAREIPPEGTIIWVWFRESYHRMGIGPARCCVGTHWHERDVQAHVLGGKEWVWLSEDRIFAESREECVRLGLEKEAEALDQLKNDYERRVTLVEGLKAKWLT